MAPRALKTTVGVGGLAAALFGGWFAFSQTNGPKPTDWACASIKDPNEVCAFMTLRESFPQDDTDPNTPPSVEVLHLVNQAVFRVVRDGNGYILTPTGGDWPAGFAGYPPLRWVDGAGLLPDYMCKPRTYPLPKPSAAPVTVPPPPETYAHFISERLSIHLDDNNYKDVAFHNLRIYPIDPTTHTKTRSFCLSFDPIAGGSHNGAVHADGDG
jgi:hypothetical protein